MRLKYTLLSTAVGLAIGSAAQAQTAPAVQVQPAAAAGGTDAITDIVVTARRKEESASKVPASIAALTATDLEKQNIRSEVDMQRAVTGLTVKEGLNSNQLVLSIRGQSVDPFTSSPPAVLTYVNEVQVNSLSSSSFFDLSSIQVLKGPQGTLFGKNTTGGAVLYETTKPGREFGGYISARAGNLHERQISGAVDIPLSPDLATLRVAGQYRERDGYIWNLLRKERIGDGKSDGVRGTLDLHPGDRFKNVLMVQYATSEGSAGGILYSANRCGAPGTNSSATCAYGPTNADGTPNAFFNAYVAANPGLYPNGLYAYSLLQKQLGPYQAYENSPAFYSGHNTTVTNTTTFALNDNSLLKNVFGFYDGKYGESLDVDASPYPVFNYGPIGSNGAKVSRSRQVSEELQIQGKAFDRALDYIVGGYYSHTRLNNQNPQFAFDFSPLAPGGYYPLDSVARDTSKAVFAQGTYDLSVVGLNGLSVTGGLRYTWVDVELDQLPGSIYYNLPGGVRHRSGTFKKPSWQIGFDYKPSGELMLYVVHRGSWRTGGFSDSSAPLPGNANVGGSGFDPETVKDVELGVKYNGYLAGMPTRINAAGFYQWIKSVQRELAVSQGGATGALTVNVPEAQVRGFEFDAQIKPARAVTIGGQLTYVNAKYSKPQIVLAVSPGAPVAAGPYADTPEVSAAAYVQVQVPLDEALGRVSVRGDVYYQTHTFFSSFNGSLNPDTRLPAYTLVNARIDWEHMFGSRFSASAYANNITKEKYYTGGLANGFLLGTNVANVGAPRTYGVEVKVEF